MPPAEEMDMLGPLMNMCVLMIDVIGRFRLSSSYRDKAQQARVEAEAREFKKTIEERQVSLWKFRCQPSVVYVLMSPLASVGGST